MFFLFQPPPRQQPVSSSDDDESFFKRNQQLIAFGVLLVSIHVFWRWVQNQKHIVRDGREYPWYEVSYGKKLGVLDECLITFLLFLFSSSERGTSTKRRRARETEDQNLPRKKYYRESAKSKFLWRFLQGAADALSGCS